VKRTSGALVLKGGISKGGILKEKAPQFWGVDD
jgi:hypothetical protein